MKKILSIVCTIILSLIIVSCAKDIEDFDDSITSAKKPYISYALFEATKLKNDNSYNTKLWLDFTATAETYGKKIKDAGFVIGFTYYRQDATLRDADIIVKGTFSGSTSTYSGEVKWSLYSGGHVRAYFVLEDGTEIYGGKGRYLPSSGATIEYKPSGN